MTKHAHKAYRLIMGFLIEDPTDSSLFMSVLQNTIFTLIVQNGHSCINGHHNVMRLLDLSNFLRVCRIVRYWVVTLLRC